MARKKSVHSPSKKNSREAVRSIAVKSAKSLPARAEANAIVDELEKLGSRKFYEDLGKRYGIHTKKAFGVPLSKIRIIAKHIGPNHELAAYLWNTGWYEARLLTAFIDDPRLVTAAQMDQWAEDFDNWGICDTLCFHLFDRTPHAFGKIFAWSRRREEFAKRAAFALLASVALHDKKAEDERFAKCLPLIARAAIDDRNFVKKAVSWALRSIGHRSINLHREAAALAQTLANSDNSTSRWIGKDVVRDLSRPLVRKKLLRRRD